ncbi:hypothetical protein AYO41_04140 [Verrucomicrobia bacterium SCGC AG-212-E04]|nr:hypothetical protein AYO41_04140 [Verrucomicrobia bacterium SCGC AG-212-E04]
MPESREFQRRRFLRRLFGWLLGALGFLCRLVLVVWATLAIYYSNLPWPWLRLTLGGLFLVFAFWALWLTKRPRRFLLFAAVYALVLLWWSFISASHDRNWRTEVAVMPRANVEGDNVRITGVRNFAYRSVDDFDVRYEERKVQLSHLQAVDLYVSYWHDGPVGHTFLSFIFDNAPPVCISIETRPEVGEGFDPIASLFKQFELIYVVGDEHDLVGVRVVHRHEDVYLYRIHTSPENAQALFRIYLHRINELADRAEWYHLLSNSCTINIIRYANKIAPRPFNIRHFLNGLIDRYIYTTGAIRTDLPFDELRRRSHLNEVVAKEYDAPDFSHRIRAGVPTVHQ